MVDVLVILLGYAIGSIPFAFLAARHLGGIDLREAGSGNLGAANVFRTTTLVIALVVVALDIAKGALAVSLAGRVASEDTTIVASGVAAVLGHVYPVWLGFRGGKGVAAACGVFSMLAPAATAAAIGIFIATVWATRYVSVGSIVSALSMAPLMYITGARAPAIAGALVTAVVIVQRHRTNLARLQTGTERRIGQRV